MVRGAEGGKMKTGDRVMVSDFQGDIEIIGVEAEFIKMSKDNQFMCRSVNRSKYANRSIIKWKYCESIESIRERQ